MSDAQLTYKGIPVSRGVVVGKIKVHRHAHIQIDESKIAEDRVEIEMRRFIDGRKKSKEQLETVYQKALVNLGEEDAEVFEGHIEILMDDDIEEAVFEAIQTERMCAELAVKQVMEMNAREMEELDNPYMQERASDIRDIGNRMIYAVAGIELSSLEDLDEEVIILAQELTPSDTAQMDTSKVLGFVTEAGGATSHVAIMAQSLELPAVVGAGASLLLEAVDGMLAVLDACTGEIVLNPSSETISEFMRRRDVFLEERELLSKLKDAPAITVDGHQIEICANIGSEKDVDAALANGAEGVGLFRTEFLYMDRPQFPTEEEQFEAYRTVAEKMGDRAVIIRTMDIGGDKGLSYLDFPPEENPFLGWRAIRMCLDMPEILRAQLRAILRASAHGKLRIMYPMVISVEEIRALNEVLANIKSELDVEGIPYDKAIESGIMIETPAAAFIAEDLIDEVDFFSIGTNDLTQYTLAVDRGNQKIAQLYQPFHPAVLRIIKHVIDASHKAGKWTGMCGELAGNEHAALILLGMGLDEFSMGAVNIGRIKRLIRSSSYVEVKQFTAQVLAMRTVTEIRAAVERESARILDSVKE